MVKMRRGTKIGWALIAVSIILCLWVIVGSSKSVADGPSMVDGILTYNESSNSISGYANTSDLTQLIVMGDATIANGAFTGCSNLQSVYITGSATIDSNAFSGCTSLVSINISGNASFGTEAFFGCSSLTDITIGGSLSDAYTSSFYGCAESGSLAITIGSSGTCYMSGGALYKDTTLIYVPSLVSNLTVAGGTTAIAEGALNDASSLVAVTFADPIALSSFGSQDNWPSSTLNTDSSLIMYVYAIGASDDVKNVIESYFTANTTETERTRIKRIYDNASDVDTFTVNLTEIFYDTNGDEKETKTSTVTCTGTLTANTYEGYTLSSGNSPYTVTSDNENVIFTYIQNDSSETTYTVSVTEIFYDTDGTSKISEQTTSKTTTGTLTATTYDGYTLTSGNSPFTVTANGQSVTFTYKKNSSSDDTTTTQYTVTVIQTFVDTSGVAMSGSPITTTAKYNSGDTITAKTYDNFTLISGNSPYTVTGNATVVFSYKAQNANAKVPASSTDSDTKKTTYTVTVYDYFYKADGTTKISQTTRRTDTYTAGDTYSYEPSTYTGYTYFDSEYPSGTVNKNRTAIFKYKKTDDSAAATNSKYKITSGANQTVTQEGGPIQIVCDGPMDKLRRVVLDGADANKNSYTLESGSTILTLTYNYIKSLSVGTHVLRFEYTDGFAETNIYITAPKTTTTVTYSVGSDGTVTKGHTKDTTPQTADGFDERYLLCMAVFLLGVGTIIYSRQRKLDMVTTRNDEE